MMPKLVRAADVSLDSHRRGAASPAARVQGRWCTSGALPRRGREQCRLLPAHIDEAAAKAAIDQAMVLATDAVERKLIDAIATSEAYLASSPRDVAWPAIVAAC